MAGVVALIAGGVGTTARAQSVVNEVVASVDGQPITRHDVEVFLVQAGQPVPNDDFADSPEARKAIFPSRRALIKPPVTALLSARGFSK